MGILLMVHSLVRWAIVAVAAGVLVKFTLGWRRQQPYDGLARGLAGAFSGLMDLQALLGLIYLLWSGFASGQWPLYRFEHMFIMIVAVVVAHLPMRWKNAPDALRYRNTLFACLASLLLVLAGVAALPGGWTR